jgi:ABC-type bacteriocin/lantibiotic exporter with double-glycine peptidase domain
VFILRKRNYNCKAERIAWYGYLRNLCTGNSRGTGKAGIQAKAVRADPESFKEDFTLPAVARIVRKDGTAHYVVVCLIKKGGKMKIMDPATDGIQKTTVGEFYGDFDGVLVMAVPNEEFVTGKERSKSYLVSQKSAKHRHHCRPAMVINGIVLPVSDSKYENKEIAVAA